MLSKANVRASLFQRIVKSYPALSVALQQADLVGYRNGTWEIVVPELAWTASVAQAWIGLMPSRVALVVGKGFSA